MDNNITNDQQENMEQASNDTSLQSDQESSSPNISKEDLDDLMETLDACKIRLATYTKEALEKYINKKSEEYTKQLDQLDANDPDFEETMESIATDLANLKKTLNSYSNNLLFMQQTLEDQSKSSLLKSNHDKYKINNTNTKPNVDMIAEKAQKNKLTDEQIRLFIWGNAGDLIKVPLLNSGFNILLRDPKSNELDIVFNRLADDIKSYTRMLGAAFFTFADLEIKEIMMDFIESLIVDSNLVDWNKKHMFKKSLSLHDYDVILHSISTLMYPEKYTYVYTCPKCEYKEELDIDLKRLKYFNFDIVPEDCLGIVSDISHMTKSKYRNYHKLLGFNKDIQWKSYILHLRVPTMYQYFSYGKLYNKKLLESINSEDTAAVNKYIVSSYFKQFLPWIKSIDTVDSNGNIIFTITKPDTIEEILDQMQKDDPSILDKILDFVKQTKITHIAYPVNPCPNCKSLPPNAVNGFIPFDVQSNFFSQLATYSIQMFLRSKKNKNTILV